MRTLKKPTPSESEVQRNGIAYLKAMGWKVWRRNVGRMKNSSGKLISFGEPGMSDCWGITPDGRHFELEFKREGKRPTKAQLAWLKSMNTGCTPAWWVDNTATLQRVAEFIADGYSVRYFDDGSDEYDLIER